MKNFIYLPLIALIILTGCKSNSFTTQRYTKFGHNAHKNSIKNPEVVKNETKAEEPVETEVVKSPHGPMQLIVSGFSTLKENIVKSNRKSHNINENEGNAVSMQGEEFSNDATVTSHSAKASVRSQKVVTEKTHAKGVVGDALETAIWIVLVVIFVILIIFLLSVIF